MVRERRHFYRPVGNVERAEIRIGEFVFKHQAPMPVEPNIHASERLYPRAVELILLVKCATDIRLDMWDCGAESDAHVGLQMAEKIFAALPGKPAVDNVAESVIESMQRLNDSTVSSICSLSFTPTPLRRPVTDTVSPVLAYIFM